MDTAKIGTIEAIFFILVVITNKIILNLPKSIILQSGTSAWINVIYISVIAIIFVWIISKLYDKFSSYDIIDISEYLGGKWFKTIVGSLYILIPLIISATIIREFSDHLKLMYFRDSPLVFIMLFFLVGSIVANRLGLKAIVKSNLIIMPIVILSLGIILLSSTKDFSFDRLFPILGYGAQETFFSGLTNIFAFSGIVYLFFLMPFLKNSKDFKKISIISIIISSVYLLLSVIGLLIVFSFSTFTDEPISIYVITRNLQYGDFFQRVDALFILLWILSTFSYLSISMFLMTYIFKKVCNLSDRKFITYPLSGLVLGLALIPKNTVQIRDFMNSYFKYFIIIFVFIISTIILFIANIKKKQEEKNSLQEAKN